MTDANAFLRNLYDPPALPVETMPKDNPFLALLDDGSGSWFELFAWSTIHEQFMPRHCISDPTNWFADCQNNGTRMVGWWPFPKQRESRNKDVVALDVSFKVRGMPARTAYQSHRMDVPKDLQQKSYGTVLAHVQPLLDKQFLTLSLKIVGLHFSIPAGEGIG